MMGLLGIRLSENCSLVVDILGADGEPRVEPFFEPQFVVNLDQQITSTGPILQILVGSKDHLCTIPFNDGFFYW